MRLINCKVVRKYYRKSTLACALALLFVSVISCEKDFAEIGTSVISNTKFGVKDTILEVFVTQKDIDAVRGDNIVVGSTGDFWLGVYANDDYEKIESSLVTQLATQGNITLNDGASETTTITTSMDNAFLKFPYVATLNGKKDVTVKINGKDSTFMVPSYTLDNVLGTTAKGVSLKVYRNNTYLSELDPQNPAKVNSYKSDAVYEKGDLLSKDANFTFIPNANDTIYIYDRYLKNGTSFKDTLKLTNANPFLTIPLDVNKIKTILFDKINSSELTTQEALNDYFRGLIIEASGDENSLVPFSFVNLGQQFLTPSLEINYTNTVENKSTNEVIDTIKNSISFRLTGIQNRIYKMTDEVNSPSSNQVIIQGMAGKGAEVKILQGNQLQELKSKNWLINDATLTFYIDQSRDTTAVPNRLFLYKEVQQQSVQIQDTHREGFATFSGLLQKENNKNTSYSFRITDHVSDVLGVNSLENSNLFLRVYNTTDNPILNNVLDTIVKSYNWDPRAVTIFNQNPSNGIIKGTKKAQLKISYTEKKK
ncbi:hypothetical protein DIS07_04910 [Polaribacter aquimarinus]|uniref:DUF4270 domain-containing protein n=1 Tax=Polaribacter aquimarinus TaxID=2100726 RepID=A0A2U2JBS7_9FLAO|nr:hypothetical protein DIS07_04910 [Polaribacter aquimarinus]